MNLRKNLDLSQASQSYLLANSASYLAWRLQNDPVVLSLSKNVASSEILKELRIALECDPQSLEEAVWPYVLVTAISLSGNIADLQEAAGLQPKNFRWHGLIASMLLANSSPLSRAAVETFANTAEPTIAPSGLPTRVEKVSLEPSPEVSQKQ